MADWCVVCGKKIGCRCPYVKVEDDVVDDQVNHPPHYKSGGIETIDFIEAKDLGFCLGNAVKYITRAGKKDPSKHLEDLQKARWYLDREILATSKARNL